MQTRLAVVDVLLLGGIGICICSCIRACIGSCRPEKSATGWSTRQPIRCIYCEESVVRNSCAGPARHPTHWLSEAKAAVRTRNRRSDHERALFTGNTGGRQDVGNNVNRHVSSFMAQMPSSSPLFRTKASSGRQLTRRIKPRLTWRRKPNVLPIQMAHDADKRVVGQPAERAESCIGESACR